MIATSMAAPGIPATETGEPIAPDGKLTVIMPTYNHGHFIAQALDSVFRQTRRPDRVIVLDDGSTDDTAAVVKPYLGRVPPVEYIRMAQNRGVIEVMNVGLGMVETDFVTFLAADDMLELSAYEKTLCTLERYPQAAICGVLTQLIDEDGCPLARRHDFDFGTGARYLSSQECLARLNRYGGLFGGVGAVFRSWSLKRAGGFAHDLLAFCDGFRYQELALTYGVCIVPEKLALWRQSRGSYAATSTLDPERSIAILQAVRMRLAQPSSPFPAAYGRRLVRRLRFAAARAALAQERADRAMVKTAIGMRSDLWADVMAQLRRMTGPWPATLLLMAILRPFDILPGVKKRYGEFIDAGKLEMKSRSVRPSAGAEKQL